MSLAIVHYLNGSLRRIDTQKALEAWAALTGETEPTPEQADWLNSVRNIYLSPSIRPKGYAEAHQSIFRGMAVHKAAVQTNEAETAHLTHAGIEQGMTQALPTGDRD